MEKILKGKTPLLIIAVACLVVYFRSIFFGFTYLDDNVLILDNLYFLRNPGNLFKAFSQEVFHVLHASASYYRPILTISFMIDSWFGGSNPFVYHLMNVLIHIVNSILLFIFFQKIRIKKELSFIFALIFAIHPVLSQAVSWVPGRNDSLLALFVLPAFIFLIDYIESKTPKYFISHLLFFNLALYTKESSVFIPLLVFYYIFAFYGKKRIKEVFWLFSISYFISYVVWFFLRSIALINSPLSYGFIDAAQTVFKNSPAVLLYIGKVFFPINLTVLPTLVDSTLSYGIAASVLFALFLFLSKNKDWQVIIFGSFWFLIFILTSFVRPINAYAPDFIEHRLYLPVVGLFIVLSQIGLVRNLKFDSKLIKFTLFVLVAILSGINLYHGRVFENRIDFWKDAVFNSPTHPLAHKNLGAMYYLDGNLGDAKYEFEKAVKLNPGEQMVYNNLGLISFDQGDYLKAEEYYKKEFEINPGYDNTFYNWGLLYWKQDKKDEAAEMWEKAVAVNPDHLSALKALAIYYSEVKNELKANYFYSEAVKRGVSF